MRLSALFFAAAAATAVASEKAIDAAEYHAGHIETVVFKRDAVLTPRDLKLAEQHGVNTTESKWFPGPPTNGHIAHCELTP